MTTNRKLLRYVPIIAGGLFVSSAAMGLIFFINNMLEAPPKPKKMIQQISLIKPPPPPPVVEQPPEPEMEEKIDVPKPEEALDDMPENPDDLPPPGDMLGLDADGTSGIDGFGLVGRKGGRDLIGSDGNGNGQFGWYAGVIEQNIYDFLADYKKLKQKKYSVIVRVWTDASGRIQRVSVVDPNNDQALENSLKKAITEIGSLDEKPPAGMPQPIRVKIASR